MTRLTWPAWDSDPGLQPKPPSKFMQDKTNSTALSTSILSIFPWMMKKKNRVMDGCEGGCCHVFHQPHNSHKLTSNASVATAQKENLVSISPVNKHRLYHIILMEVWVWWMGESKLISPHLSPANEPSSCCSPTMYATTLSTSMDSRLSYKHKIYGRN